MNQNTETINTGIAKTSNIGLVSMALEQLGGRQNTLPGIGVIYGPAGRGKSVACAYIANAKNGYYVQMRSAWARKTLYEKILFEMGIKPAGTIPQLLDQICEQLAASRRPLIIDEFDFCLRNDSMIESVRDIYEGSQGTLLLVGEEGIPQKLRRWDRFHSRVLSWIPALPASMKDAKAIAPIYCRGVEVADDLLQHLVESAHGSIRYLATNLAQIQAFALENGRQSMALADWDTNKTYTGEPPKPRRAA